MWGGIIRIGPSEIIFEILDLSVDTGTFSDYYAGVGNIMRETHNNQMTLYNSRLLVYQMQRLNKTPEEIAVESGISENSVNSGLAGNLRTLKKLRSLSDALRIKWEFITDIDLPETEFSRAVQRGGAKKGG